MRGRLVAAAGVAVVVACGDGEITSKSAPLASDAGIPPDTSNDAGRATDDATALRDASDEPDASPTPALTFQPRPGGYVDVLCISIISATAGDAIHYTTDGSLPTTASPLYTGSIPVRSTTTITAVGADGNVVVGQYAINDPLVAFPPVSIAPEAGDATSPLGVVFTTPGSTGLAICSTTDGTPPECGVGFTGELVCQPDGGAGPICTHGQLGESISITADAGTSVTVSAIACAAGTDNSFPATATYRF